MEHRNAAQQASGEYSGRHSAQEQMEVEDEDEELFLQKPSEDKICDERWVLKRQGWRYQRWVIAYVVFITVLPSILLLERRRLSSFYRPAWCDQLVPRPQTSIEESWPRTQLPPLCIRNGKLMRQDVPSSVQIQGINWFGFENTQTMVDGLWGGSGTDLVREFQAVVHQIRMLGFNGVRMPFVFEALKLQPESKVQKCTRASLKALAKRLTDPDLSNCSAQLRKRVPRQPFCFANFKRNLCNTYLDVHNNTQDRFLWTIQYFLASGFYVVIDFHPTKYAYSSGMDGGPWPTHWTTNTSAFAAAWSELWGALVSLPRFENDIRGRVFLDLINEPSGLPINMTWDGSYGRPSLAEYYLSAMDAMESIAPGAPLFFVEGLSGGLGVPWGDGFVTNASVIAEYDMPGDASAFFQRLMRKPYLERTVISPHQYGPMISKSDLKGKDLIQRWHHSWGHLQDPGFCDADTSACHKFAVIPGELGSRFTDPGDVEYFESVAAYWSSSLGPSPLDSRIDSWFWWCYPANGGDTGGILKDNWMHIDWIKIRYMTNKLGLIPWYNSARM